MIMFSLVKNVFLFLALAGVTLQTRPRQPCKVQGCNNCLGTPGCAWSKVTFVCQPAGGPDTVVNYIGCRQMNQQQGVFPAVKKKSAAGVITPTVSAEFARISQHIFRGEPTNMTSGRHTSDSWTSANPQSRLIGNDSDTHLMFYENGFYGKTVWDSQHYSEVDIKNMCAVAIGLGDREGLSEGAFIVQTPFGAPVCIHHFRQGTGSCFPLSFKPFRVRLGRRCNKGDDNDKDVQEHFDLNE